MIFLFIIEILDFIIVLAQKYQVLFCKSPTETTGLDFMDPIFLIFMTSISTVCNSILFELGSMPIKLCLGVGDIPFSKNMVSGLGNFFRVLAILDTSD